MWDELVGLFVVASTGLNVWQWAEARIFPLHRRAKRREPCPGVSIIKPLKGSHDGLQECLESWMLQNYQGPFEVLFVVDDLKDPAYEVAAQLIQSHPKIQARILVCTGHAGANRKVNKLVCGVEEASYEIIVISDADVQAPPDLLTNLVVGLEAPNVGLVCCFYRITRPRTFAEQFDAMVINGDFWPSVLQARRVLGLRFALGAVMASRKSVLAEIGGIGQLRDHLADDYWLGRLVSETGKLILICPVVVNLVHGRQSFKDIWRRHLRWARTIRVCEPVGYFFSVLSNLTVWVALWLVLCGRYGSLPLALLLLFLRMALVADQQHRMTQGWTHLRWVWVVPIKDLVQACLWLCAWLGNRVWWAGRFYRLRLDGTIQRIDQ